MHIRPSFYSKFHSSELACIQVDDQNYDENCIEQDHDERDVDYNYDDSIELSPGLKEQHDGHLATKKNGRHCIFYICNEVYHLKDAFQELFKVYGII